MREPQYSGAGWRLYVGDCLAVLPELPSGAASAIVTDPPYSSGGMVRGDRMASTRVKYQSTDVVTEFADFSGDNRDQRAFAYWCALWLGECRRVVSSGGMLCQFTDWRQLPTTTDAIQSGGWVWRGIVPWDKVVARPMPNRFRSQCEYMVWATNGPRDFDTKGDPTYGDGVIRITTTPTADREHTTQKPVELIEAILATASNEGDTILDPFVGSGTTGVACIKTGRRFIGIEIDEHYASIAAKRLQRAEADVRNSLPFPEPEPRPKQAQMWEARDA